MYIYVYQYMYLTDLEHRDIVWDLLHRLLVEGVELPIVIFSTKPNFTTLEVGDVDVPGGPVRRAGGLEHAGSQGGAAGELVELLGTEVIHEDVEGEHILKGRDGEVLVQDGRHGCIVDGEDGDGLAAVDLGGEVGDGEVVVEGGELRVLGENAGDVVCLGGGGEEEEDGGEGES